MCQYSNRRYLDILQGYMDSISDLHKFDQLKRRGEQHKRFLHSPAHLVADELSRQFGDAKHFGFYLKLAEKHNHDFLRKIAQEVKEQRNVKNPARLFVFLVKKANQSNNITM